MSQENVELGRRAIEAVNRRDFDAFLAFMDDDVVIVSRIAAVEGGLRGHDGARTWWQNWFGSFPDYEIEILETREAGDMVVATIQALGHGSTSDVPLEERIWHGSRWRKGKCVWWRVFRTEAEALEAAGLSE
jgi:ketosteroid isomerase-like protein